MGRSRFGQDFRRRFPDTGSVVPVGNAVQPRSVFGAGDSAQQMYDIPLDMFRQMMKIPHSRSLNCSASSGASSARYSTVTMAPSRTDQRGWVSSAVIPGKTWPLSAIMVATRSALPSSISWRRDAAERSAGLRWDADGHQFLEVDGAAPAELVVENKGSAPNGRHLPEPSLRRIRHR
jgi:hypothetical protein